MFFTSKDKVDNQEIKEKLLGQEYRVIVPAEKIIDENGQEVILYKMVDDGIKELDVFSGGDDE